MTLIVSQTLNEVKDDCRQIYMCYKGNVMHLGDELSGCTNIKGEHIFSKFVEETLHKLIELKTEITLKSNDYFFVTKVFSKQLSLNGRPEINTLSYNASLSDNEDLLLQTVTISDSELPDLFIEKNLNLLFDKMSNCYYSFTKNKPWSETDLISERGHPALYGYDSNNFFIKLSNAALNNKFPNEKAGLKNLIYVQSGELTWDLVRNACCLNTVCTGGNKHELSLDELCNLNSLSKNVLSNKYLASLKAKGKPIKCGIKDCDSYMSLVIPELYIKDIKSDEAEFNAGIVMELIKNSLIMDNQLLNTIYSVYTINQGLDLGLELTVPCPSIIKFNYHNSSYIINLDMPDLKSLNSKTKFTILKNSR